MRRRGLAFLPIGLLLLAVAEIAVFIAVVNAIGAFYTLAVVAATSLLGMVLLRREGIKGWRAFRAAAEAGRPPGEQVSNSLIGLLGAMLLAMPGLISSAVGLLLVIPPFRTLARRSVRRAAERKVSSAVAGDLFGPRRVRVRRGDPMDDAPPPSSSTTASVTSPVQSTTGTPASTARAGSSDVLDGEVVEGEIVR